MGMMDGAQKMTAGTMKALGSIVGSGARKREEKAAQSEFNQYKADFNNMDTSNLYENQSNVMEDLTVNTKEAEFQAQQNQQNQANMMGGMSSAAGGSGIAALAQAMAGQQSQNAQQAGVSIGNQQSKNQTLALQEQSRVNDQIMKGAEDSRNLKGKKIETQFGMAQKRLGAAKEARAASTDALISGISDTAVGFTEVAGSLATGGATDVAAIGDDAAAGGGGAAAGGVGKS